MANKKLYINLINENKEYNREAGSDGYIKEDYYLGTVGPDEYNHIYLDNLIEPKELENAIDIIITYLMQSGSDRIYVDLDKRDQMLAPAKEMTMEEVEAALGYKVKIIK